MLCQECVLKRQDGVGRTFQASCSGHLSWKESCAFGLQGDGLPPWNSHNLFGQEMSLYSSPSHRCALTPSPEHAGAALGCEGCGFGSCCANSWNWNASTIEFHPSLMWTAWTMVNLITDLSSGLSDLLNCTNSGSFSLTSPFRDPSCFVTACGFFMKNWCVFVGLPLGDFSPMVRTVPNVFLDPSRPSIP